MLQRRVLDGVRRASAARGTAVQVMVLLASLAAVHLGAFVLRLPPPWDAAIAAYCAQSVALILAVKGSVFLAYRVHRDWHRLVSFYDLVTLCHAATVASMLVALADFLLLNHWNLPRSVFLIDWGATILAVGGMRAAARWVHELRRQRVVRGGGKRVLIAAAEGSGEIMLHGIDRDRRLGYHVIGLIVPEGAPPADRVAGKPVLGSIDQLGKLIEQHDVDEVLISTEDWPGRVVRRIFHEAQRQGVPVKVVPSMQQLLADRVVIQPRPVAIQDLLKREPVHLDGNQLHRWLNGKTVFVTGSAGSIGSEICRQLLRFQAARMVLLDWNETGQFYLHRELTRCAQATEIVPLVGDVSRPERVDQILRCHQPQVVFHAAAYKHVPLMEANPGEAVVNIVQATRVLADRADAHGVEALVMISSDKAVQPTSVMGACKRVAELYVQALSKHSPCRFVTVRFGNVLDSSGSVVAIFRQQIAEGGPVTITHPEMRRYFMTIPEASRLVLQAGAMGRGGEIFVLDMGVPVRIVDLAKDMIRLSGLKLHEDIEMVYTGLRPGEKLSERLHWENEQHRPTSHPKILIAAGSPQPLPWVEHHVDQLVHGAYHEPATIVDLLQEVVPQYRPDGLHLPTRPMAA